MKSDDPLDLTVQELVAHGVDGVEASCNYCGRSWLALINIMPDQTTLRKVRALLACPTCGSADVDIEPQWPNTAAAH